MGYAMSVPYVPLYVVDYEADTSHLTIEEDGAYWRLLRLCWRTAGCSIPNDREWIQRRLRVDDEAYERSVQPVIDEFFKIKAGRLYQARLLREWQLVNEKSKKRSEAGKKGGRPPKLLENNESNKSNAFDLLKQPEPEPELNKKENIKRKTTMSENWHPNDKCIQYALDKGIERIEDETARFIDYHRSRGKPSADWDASWRTWIRNSVKYKQEAFKSITKGSNQKLGLAGIAARRRDTSQN